MLLKEIHKVKIVLKLGRNILEFIKFKLKDFKEWLMASMI